MSLKDNSFYNKCVFKDSKPYLRLTFGSGSNPGFDLNYPGSKFWEKPGFSGSGSNPGSIPTSCCLWQKVFLIWKQQKAENDVETDSKICAHVMKTFQFNIECLFYSTLCHSNVQATFLKNGI